MKIYVRRKVPNNRTPIICQVVAAVEGRLVPDEHPVRPAGPLRPTW